jgi:23S rRNA pseudouridine1911/1915/1917 synthase
MPAKGVFSIRVKPSDEAKRLDVLVASVLTDLTRTFIAGLITAAHICVDGRPRKPGYRVKSGEQISGVIPPPQPVEFKPEPIPLDVLFEDGHIIVVNKPPGLVVHPAPGHFSGTLVNGLLNHCPDLGGIGGELRPGIVHRLDKDTSGTLVIAKNDAAHTHLARQFKARQVQKEYLALVHGDVQSASGTVNLPIGRHPVHRKRMSAFSPRGRSAQTDWTVKERFRRATLLVLNLKTGRTHQIRVHCAALHHPIVGDAVYRPRKLEIMPAAGHQPPDEISRLLKSAGRQMLHAWRLRFIHPHTGKTMLFESAVPPDMQALIDALRSTGNDSTWPAARSRD